MANADVVMGLTEERDIFATFTPASGTLTLASCTVSLYDTAKAAAGGLSGTAATGITSGASAAPQAWYTFKPTTLTLAVGLYRLVFLSVDSNGKKRRQVVWVMVRGDSG